MVPTTLAGTPSGFCAASTGSTRSSRPLPAPRTLARSPKPIRLISGPARKPPARTCGRTPRSSALCSRWLLLVSRSRRTAARSTLPRTATTARSFASSTLRPRSSRCCSATGRTTLPLAVRPGTTAPRSLIGTPITLRPKPSSRLRLPRPRPWPPKELLLVTPRWRVLPAAPSSFRAGLA
eukprot:Amastigsp_a676241_1052.p3 type:complete len:180 gc:universal Amastigsp_a676241_1052:989-1528(+)